ncbi:hypothetical protein [Sphingobium yanoikuyae]|uniref:hypothetical protein n=1 Tax=Sphingobium yanoikuyae TaxID=13690 RepID=UPI001F2C2557|nr:hypothetical protein [Sphingobium yanoikuyae]
MKKDPEIVRFQLDPGNLLPLTEMQRAELDALQALPDSEIDYSDLLALSGDFWKGAKRAGREILATVKRRKSA